MTNFIGAPRPFYWFYFLAFVCAHALGPLSPDPTFGQSSPPFSLTGYVKNLGIWGQSYLTEDPYLLNLSRIRTTGDVALNRWLHTEVSLDTELLVGSFLRTTEYSLRTSQERGMYFDLDWPLVKRQRYVVRQHLFRATATADVRDVQFTLGRQRIGWGTGAVWNPTDLLNPVDPLLIERKERRGIDAVYASHPIRALSEVEMVFAPGRRDERSSAAIRARTNVREYDLSGMGGYVRGDWIAGGDFAGYVRGGGVRSEVAIIQTNGSAHVRAVLNGDYNLPGNYYVLLELYHNGPGTRNTEEYDHSALLSSRILNLAKDYAAGSLRKSFTPLVDFDLHGLWNLNDGSRMVRPTLTWSLLENVELVLSSHLFFGDPRSEYGVLENVYFGSLQLYY